MNLTEEQKDYIREHSSKKAVSRIGIECRASRHDVLAFIIQEKLSMRTRTTMPKKPKERVQEGYFDVDDPSNHFFY